MPFYSIRVPLFFLSLVAASLGPKWPESQQLVGYLSGLMMGGALFTPQPRDAGHHS